MKTLVFTSAVGHDYHLWADRLFKSLRYGRYTGDIICLTDTSYKPKPSVDVRPVIIQPNVFDDIPRKVKRSHRPRMSRFYLDRLFDIKPYDQIFYLDCDCRVVDLRDFNKLVRPGNWFTRRSQKFGTVSYINDRYATHALSLDQIRAIAKESTVSSGSWLVDRAHYSPMAEQVRKIFRERCKWENDQPALNAFLYENKDWYPWQFFLEDEIQIVMSIDAHLNALDDTIVIHPAGRPK